MDKQGQSRCELVLVPCPFQGHITPMLQLATMLHSKCFSITIIHTDFNSPNPSNHPDFTFLPMYNEQVSSQDVVELIKGFNINCKAPLQELLAPRASKGEISCIIYDRLMYFVDAVANDLGLSSIAFYCNSAINALTRYAYPQLEMEGYLPLQDSISLDLVPGFHPLRFRDLPIFNYKNSDALLQVLADFCSLIRYPSAIIWNTIEFLEHSSLEKYQQRHQIPFFTLGPLNKFAPASSSSLLEEDISCISWLDKQRPNSVLYVSLGSLASMDKKQLNEMAWGLANSKQPFLWVIRPGSVSGSEWIELLPDGFVEVVCERGCIVKWAPQKVVLAHDAVGGFWSHCGWNSTVESISEGVPMICWPYFLDQRVHARYLSHVWRLGIAYENELESGEVKETVRRLMVSEEGQEMRQRAMEFKEKVELCIKPGGCSYNSLNELAKYISTLKKSPTDSIL